MFGIRFAKFEPGLYVFKYKKGRITAQGEGLAFYYYAPAASLVVVPVGSADAPFIFAETSADFQELTIQGQLTYRISEPGKTAKMLNYTVDNRNLTYISEDPGKLPERLINLAQIAAKGAVKKLSLKQAIVSSDETAQRVYGALAENAMVNSLGVEILSVSIAAIRPNPETAKALEAETREQILKESDQAIFQRRNYAVEQERTIRESELNTEIAVENKNREIQETKLETERLAMQKQLEIREEQLAFNIHAEEKNRELVDLRARNERIEADTKAYALAEIMKVYEKTKPGVLESLASAGMDSGRLMALAFRDIAGQAEKIGNLNITPDLLQTIINKKP
jgi:regulator of protease activity HflC (stomatin/prohibitin superfamily)